MIRIILEYNDNEVVPINLLDFVEAALQTFKIRPLSAKLEILDGKPFRRVYDKPPTRWLDLDGMTHWSDENDQTV